MYLTGGRGSENHIFANHGKEFTWGEDIDEPELSERIVEETHGFSVGVQDVLTILMEDLLTIR
jgi:hypothetical protein